MAFGVDRDARQGAELTGFAPSAPPLADEFAFGIELLDAVVVGVGNVEVADRGDGDAARVVELAIARARRAELADEFARRVELLDAVVAGVGHPDVARGIGGHVGGGREVAGARAGAAEGVEINRHRSCRCRRQDPAKTKTAKDTEQSKRQQAQSSRDPLLDHRPSASFAAPQGTPITSRLPHR